MRPFQGSWGYIQYTETRARSETLTTNIDSPFPCTTPFAFDPREYAFIFDTRLTVLSVSRASSSKFLPTSPSQTRVLEDLELIVGLPPYILSTRTLFRFPERPPSSSSGITLPRCASPFHPARRYPCHRNDHPGSRRSAQYIPQPGLRHRTTHYMFRSTTSPHLERFPTAPSTHCNQSVECTFQSIQHPLPLSPPVRPCCCCLNLAFSHFDFTLTLTTTAALFSALPNISTTLLPYAHKAQRKIKDVGSDRNDIPKHAAPSRIGSNLGSKLHALPHKLRFRTRRVSLDTRLGA
ncbi:hypothetical protein EDB86DRAFT_2049604 [Lactarius hatsudake]|nr:hypothetical protein EDB86DRAFT_2049604 [Lactarius hatsudake]